ncbi:hypothetical protein I350_06498 [Cryptococcus amylolentus CBS 6273]|uniref:Uncharacterized protein n=1 Tax=Cryptococcus amylolentus CBS 6273 TaxID=1296118 RepID=A0A1E3JP34_9TREE|nr:hypothetical protein I350_06498 [Cryptococcus amylolentus CBS 6273]
MPNDIESGVPIALSTLPRSSRPYNELGSNDGDLTLRPPSYSSSNPDGPPPYVPPTINNINKLGPVHYELLKTLVFLISSKTMSLSKEVEHSMAPILYRDITVTSRLFNGGIKDQGWGRSREWIQDAKWRKIKYLQHTRTLRIYDRSAMWAIYSLSQPWNEPNEMLLFPYVTKVVISDTIRDMVYVFVDEDDAEKALTFRDMLDGLGKQMPRSYELIEEEPKEESEYQSVGTERWGVSGIIHEDDDEPATNNGGPALTHNNSPNATSSPRRKVPRRCRGLTLIRFLAVSRLQIDS